MFCSRCGKKVLDTMLFCPFCGSEIVLPEQENSAAPEPFGGTDGGEEVSRLSETEENVQIRRFTFESPAEETAEETAEEAPDESGRSENSRNEDVGDRHELFPGKESPDEAEDEAQDRDPDTLFPDEEELDTLYVQPDDGKPALRTAGSDDIKIYRKNTASAKKTAPEVPEMKPRDTSRREQKARPRFSSDSEREEFRSRSGSADYASMRQKRARQLANTYVSAIGSDADDIFMEEDELDAFDDFDTGRSTSYRRNHKASDKRRPRAGEEDDDEYTSSFFMRHIRGFVGVILLLVLVLVLLLYGLSDAGQTSLARINATLPLRAGIYAKLGYDSYMGKEYRQAGVYYERALARDPDNYSYASSAAMSYIAAENREQATAMLKKCIEIQPLSVEPYVYLAGLYPDAATRPGSITMLIQQGYQTTGDSRLKLN